MIKHISKKIKFTIFLIALVLVAGYFLFSQNIKPEPALVQAQTGPQINSAPVSIQHKQSITISGAGFGTKSSAAPVKWDDFEAGTVGQIIAPNNGWGHANGYDPRDPIYTNLNPRGCSTLSSWHDLTYADPRLVLYSGAWTELYTSYWIRHNITGMGEAGYENIKEFKLWGTYQDYFPEFGVEIALVYPTPTTYFLGRFDSGLGYAGNKWGLAGFPNYTWVRREVWIRVGDNPGQRFKYWENGTLKTSYVAPGDFPGGCGSYMGDQGVFSEIYFLCFIRKGSEGYSQFDDIYIDTTQARVELGNAATFASCTHREIQIPTAWSSSSITLTANQGSFNDGETAYLYVIDSEGNVNENGYPITIGTGTPDIIPPSAPTGVSVQ